MLGLRPWTFCRYTVREFEEAVSGAQIRHVHLLDVVMRHALVTGQWTKRVTFEQLTGRTEPLPLDPRVAHAVAEEQTDEDRERITRARALLAEAALRASGGRVELVEGADAQAPDR